MIADPQMMIGRRASSTRRTLRDYVDIEPLSLSS
jgi:hypothetical protein